MESMKITRDRIPDDVLKEIFPRGLNRGLASERVYSHLKQMILSGKVKKGKRLVQEQIAQKFNVSRMAVGIVFSKLKKDGKIISKRGVGSFVV
jgi:DNA-binding GntR family transcriptional regulator